eukprot:Phypoly_transcript_08713.p2 GENE.Phypoly_transcript_08713~~Phypoly_transcript_08713.p2  ORF type:complete len:117 (-),score=19.70 Phypoly_transcript_08713:328-678(-)
MGGDTDYTLSTSGTQKMDRKSLPKLDMDKFWQEMGPTISSIIDNKTDGDRLVVHFETTCHPNFDIEVSMDGRSRSFHIYGDFLFVCLFIYIFAKFGKNDRESPQNIRNVKEIFLIQ